MNVMKLYVNHKFFIMALGEGILGENKSFLHDLEI